VLCDGTATPASLGISSYANGDAGLVSPPSTRLHSGPAVKHQYWRLSGVTTPAFGNCGAFGNTRQ
jgi:hypothetical protein